MLDNNQTQKKTGIDAPGDWIKTPDGEIHWSTRFVDQPPVIQGFWTNHPSISRRNVCKCITGVHVFYWSAAVIRGLVPATKNLLFSKFADQKNVQYQNGTIQKDLVVC